MVLGTWYLILCFTKKKAEEEEQEEEEEEEGADMFSPFPLYLYCTHVVIAICVITKTDIRDPCGIFQFEHKEKDSSLTRVL